MEDETLKTFRMGLDISLDVGLPFVAYTSDNHPLILQEERLINAHGHMIYYEEYVINENPTEQEIFKVNLANPQEGKQIAWGKNNLPKDGIVGASHPRPKDS